MNTSASVKLSRFQKPKIESSKVTEWHTISKDILSDTLVSILCFFLLFNVLFNKTFSIVIKMFEDKLLNRSIWRGVASNLSLKVIGTHPTFEWHFRTLFLLSSRDRMS